MKSNSTTPTPLERYFREELKEADVHFVPNFGNAGDALIALGTFEFFSRLGVRWRLCRNWKHLKRKTVVFAGGGALVGHYPRSENTFATLLRNENRVIVLPHTITRLNKDLLRWGHNLTIFSREYRTYEYLSQFRQISRIELDHDMAFQLMGKIEEHAPFWRYLPGALNQGSIKDRLRIVKRLPKALQTRFSIHNRKTANSLNCFRQDVESEGVPLPAKNFDISADYAMGTETVGTVNLSANALLSTIGRYRIIHTDRLHCCIGGLLLGRQVEFFGNNYHKNESVYNFSIKGHNFPVDWKQSRKTGQ